MLCIFVVLKKSFNQSCSTVQILLTPCASKSWKIHYKGKTYF